MRGVPYSLLLGRQEAGTVSPGRNETGPEPQGFRPVCRPQSLELGLFLYLITIFLKHAFERVGEGELESLPRALAVVVERLVAGLEPPV